MTRQSRGRMSNLHGIAAVCLLAVTMSAAAGSEDASRSVWEGVYTVEQAQRGNAGFASHCMNCHGEAVVATGAVPPLSGKKFLYNWDSLPLEVLFDRIQLTMPMDHPGSLDRKMTADITAYVLSVNHIPAGTDELSDDARCLQEIRVDAKKPE